MKLLIPFFALIFTTNVFAGDVKDQLVPGTSLKISGIKKAKYSKFMSK